MSCDQQDDTQTLASIMERFSRRDLSFLSGLIAEIIDLEQRFGPEIAIEKIHEINATLGLDNDELSHPDTRRNR